MEALDILILNSFGLQQVNPLLHNGPISILTTPGIGGWWTRPSNWKSNTLIAFGGIFAVTYAVWSVSAEKEVSYAHMSITSL